MNESIEYNGVIIYIGQEWLCREGNSFTVTDVTNGIKLTPNDSKRVRVVCGEQLLNAYVTKASGKRRNGASRPKTGLEYKLFRYFKSMGVKGVGNAAIKKLANSGRVTSISDLYLDRNLSQLIFEASELPQVKAESISSQLRACLLGDLLNVLAAIAPKQITKHDFEKVVAEFGSIESAFSISAKEFVRRILKAPNIGSQKAKELAELMQDNEFQKNYSTLKDCAAIDSKN